MRYRKKPTAKVIHPAKMATNSAALTARICGSASGKFNESWPVLYCLNTFDEDASNEQENAASAPNGSFQDGTV